MKYLLFILFSWCAQAATYYVAPAASGGSDSNDGSIGSPWLTLGKLESASASGDTIYIRAGDYTNQTFDPTAVYNDYIIAAYESETPRFIGPTNSWVIYPRSGGSNFNVLGLTITNSLRSLILPNLTNSLLANLNIGWAPNEYVTDGVQQLNLISNKWTTVSNCIFEYHGRSGLDGEARQDFGDLVRVHAYSYSQDESYGNRFLDCRFRYGGHQTLAIQGRSNVLRNCSFENPDWMDYDSELWGNRCMELLGGSRNLIENCRVGYSGQPVDNTNFVAAIEVCSSFNILRRLSFYAHPGCGVSYYYKAGSSDGILTNNYLFHNSMVSIGFADWQRDDADSAVWFASANAVATRIVNNAFQEVAGDTIEYTGGDTNWSTNHFRVEGNYDGNPIFINTNQPGSETYTLPNLNLQSDSPCIDAGEWLTTITTATGSGTEFEVADAGYFYDGWGIPGEVGDAIQLEGQTATVVITGINGNTITVDSTLTWTQGDGVALPYSGAAPDQGAFEYATPSGLITPTGTGNYTISGSGGGTVIISAE